MNLQGFVESRVGQVVIILVIVLMLVLITLGGKSKGANRKVDIKAMTVSALLIAIAMVLSNVKIFTMPQGGSITLLSLLPIAVVTYLYGTKRGIIAGVALGLVNLIFGPYVIHPAQLLLDYPIAFGALGIGGAFRNGKNGLTKVYVVGVFARYLCAVASGIIFFGSYAPKGFNAVTWSVWYNITYIAVEAAITIVVINMPPVKNLFERIMNADEFGASRTNKIR